MQDKLFKVYQVTNYYVTNDFIENQYEEYEIDELIEVLEKKNKGYHTRIHNKTNYILFGDVDGYPKDIKDFYWKLEVILKKYGLDVDFDTEFFWTKNSNKEGSFHYSIPKYYCSCEKLKEIHLKLQYYIEVFHSMGKNKKSHIIDTTIYAEKWWRLPNQNKESKKGTEHKIVKGKMIDFIPEYIPEKSICIENNKYYEDSDTEEEEVEVKKKNVAKKKVVKKVVKKEDIVKDEDNKKDDDKYGLLRELFDKCYKEIRFNDWEDWIQVAFALKNIYGNDAFELFDNFSKKGKNYGGRENTKKRWDSIKKPNGKSIGLGTVYLKAKEDNFEEYKKIMTKYSETFAEDDFAKKIYELAGDNFIYVKQGDNNYKLYCYNGKFWESDDILMRQFISNELHSYFRELIVDIYWNSHKFNEYKEKIDSLKKMAMKKNIIESYKEYGIKKIDFDDKWWLFGFDDCVLDLSTHKFREYEKEDYISVTTGYEWREPTKEELKTMEKLICSIMPVCDEREFLIKILSTGLEGRCLEKFLVLNGSGGNGKGLLNDLILKALGNYGFVGNNAILYEKNKTGSNPEKANIHKKRFVVMRELPEKNKIENSVMKELTGGGKFSGRGHQESSTEKKLHCTLVTECNKRPLFAEEPTDGDLRRILDFLYRSKFTDDEDLLDEENHIYKAESKYKNIEFQEQHKYAILQILINAHKQYDPDKIKVPETIKQRTNSYLQMSCMLLDWFKQNYELTNKKEDFVSVADVFNKLKEDEYYFNLSKQEKRKYNKQYLFEYFSTNLLTKKYYKDIHKHNNTTSTNVLLCWKKIKKDEDEEEDEDNNDKKEKCLFKKN